MDDWSQLIIKDHQHLFGQTGLYGFIELPQGLSSRWPTVTREESPIGNSLKPRRSNRGTWIMLIQGGLQLAECFGFRSCGWLEPTDHQLGVRETGSIALWTIEPWCSIEIGVRLSLGSIEPWCSIQPWCSIEPWCSFETLCSIEPWCSMVCYWVWRIGVGVGTDQNKKPKTKFINLQMNRYSWIK